MIITTTEYPLNKWYYRFEPKGILFPTFFKSYFRTNTITPINFVVDEVLGAVNIQSESPHPKG